MSTYRLTLFGGFSLRDDRGAPITVRSKKSRCLLAYLALAQGHQVDRDVLAGLLWGDRDDSHARHSLSQELYRLRGLFSEDAQAGFELATDTVGIDPDLLDVDVLRFERGLTSGKPDVFERAAALYQGDLLAGLETGQEGFDGWLTTERERLRDRAIAGWRDLLRRQMDGPPERAIETATLLLALEPVDEDAHRALIQLYANTGRRDLALRQYEKCKLALASELGIEPDQETQALRERIETEPPLARSDQPSDASKPVEEARSEPSAPETAARAPTATEAERRQVTVLQCDLVISTPTSQQLDPEDRREVVQSAREACAEIVQRYDGSMMKPVGDGFLACLGFPRAHEDDAERAAHVGLGIIEAVHHMEVRPDTRLRARIGIATGLVVVGDTAGGGLSEERAISGEAPNLASRLQHLAAPGAILISESTQRLLDTGFEMQDLGPQGPAGSPEATNAWRVTGLQRVESRFEARHAGALTAFVGREMELQTLLHRWAQAKEGEGQVILISGEPGIGKSRLAQVVHERLADEPHTRLRYQCSPHHTNSALYPMITQLEFAAGFTADDPATDKLVKLEALLAQAIGDMNAVAPFFADLLSIPADDRYPPLNLTPQAHKESTLDALNDQILGLAAKQPVLMVFEDLHWIDPTTQEMLDLILDRVQDARVLALLTFRPDYEPKWVGQPHVTLLAPSRLTKRQCADLVRSVATGNRLSDHLLSGIIAKTEGVPLFVEELTRALLEGGKPDEIPTTLQASLLARLDRLGAAKEIAQIGSVIGREFGHPLLAAATKEDDATLATHLEALIDAGLVLAHGKAPHATYSFKHVLIQDAAYESLLKSKLERLHARIVTVIEDGFPQVRQNQPEVLALHCTGARMDEPAAKYWLAAGQRAKAVYAQEEATSYLHNCLDALSRHADIEQPSDGSAGLAQSKVRALVSLGDIASVNDRLTEANQRYQDALDACDDAEHRDWIANKMHRPSAVVRDGGRIAFYEHGTGSPTVLLVNAILYGLAAFQPIVDRLCQEFRVVTVDCRGTGDSGPLSRPYPPIEHAKDVAAIIEALRVPVIGVGISSGGNLLAMLSEMRPDLLQGLVTVGTHFKGYGLGNRNEELERQQTPAIEREDVETVLRIQSDFCFREPGTRHLSDLFLDGILKLPKDTIMSFVDGSDDVTSIMSQINVPTLLTHGTEDHVIPFSAASFALEHLPNAELHAFEGKGHLPIFTAHEEFCEVLSRWVHTHF